MRNYFLLFLLFGLVWKLPSAHAGSNGDMFGDNGMDLRNQPDVPLRYPLQGDMFPAQPPYVRTNKDMFDSVRPEGEFGGEDLFSAHLNGEPRSSVYSQPQPAGHQ